MNIQKISSATNFGRYTVEGYGVSNILTPFRRKCLDKITQNFQVNACFEKQGSIVSIHALENPQYAITISRKVSPSLSGMQKFHEMVKTIKKGITCFNMFS